MSAAIPGTATPRRALPALLLLAGTFLFYLLSFPERLYGDDVWFVSCILRGLPFATHFLFLPLARCWTWIGAHLGLDPFVSLRLLAAAGTATGTALLFAAARRRGLGGPRALLFALLVASAPSTLFFATAAEIHGLHLAAVGLLAWCLARLERDGPSTRVLAVGLAFGLVLGTHKSGVLLLPGLFALILSLTPGRPLQRRARDLAALLVAGLVVFGLKLAFTTWQLGRPFAADDSLGWYWRGLQGRLAKGYGWEQFVAYLSVDGVAQAWVVALAGAAGLGALLRRAPRCALALLLVLLPYLLFFPLFNYPERGAYYIVVLPAGAAALFAWLHPGGEARARWWPVLVPLCAAALFAPLRPEEIGARLGELVPALVALGACAWGFLFLQRAPAARAATLALAGLVVLQLVGAQRALAHYARQTPLLDWASGVCEETAGTEAFVISAGFQERWILELLHHPWPEPWRGTWSFAESCTLPGPTNHTYGDPSLPEAELLRRLQEELEAGARVYVDQGVRDFLELQPAHAGLLDLIEQRYTLLPVRSGAFRAERILLPEGSG